jgi:hypothetical protein
MRTVEGYYGGSTVVPVVVPVFWSLVPTRFLTNFLYELDVGQTPAEKPESGRVCGPKGSPKVLLGRLWGRGQVRPNAKTKLLFSLFVFWALLLFLALSGVHSSLSFVPPTASPPLKLHTRVAHILPPPPAPSAIVPLTPNPLKLRVCHRLTFLFATP